MKQKLALILAALLSCLPLVGCGDSADDDDKLRVVCSVFPAYDWARQIIGETKGVELTLLADDGTDLHSFQPSVKDIAAMQQADVLCYVGGTSDSWIADTLDTATLSETQTVVMLDASDAKAEVTVEGMQEEGHDHASDDHGHEQAEIDEHIWLSLRQASLICAAIRDALCAASPENADAFTQNCADYLAALDTLDAAYTTLVTESAVRDTILVADRFPYRYLAEDYDLTYYAAFPGCSAETEASFETIAFLSDKVCELALPYILVTETSDQSIAKTVLENAGSDAGILILDSLQSVTQRDLENGATYLERMKKNLEPLRLALT